MAGKLSQDKIILDAKKEGLTQDTSYFKAVGSDLILEILEQYEKLPKYIKDEAIFPANGIGEKVQKGDELQENCFEEIAAKFGDSPEENEMRLNALKAKYEQLQKVKDFIAAYADKKVDEKAENEIRERLKKAKEPKSEVAPPENKESLKVVENDRRQEKIDEMKNGSRELPIEEAKQNYEHALRAYVAIEHHHRTTWQSIKNFFGSALKNQESEHAEVKKERERFEESQRKYRDAWMKSIQEKGATENQKEEIEKMLMFFNYQTTMDMYDARTSARAGTLWNKEKGRVGLFNNDERINTEGVRNYNGYDVQKDYLAAKQTSNGKTGFLEHVCCAASSVGRGFWKGAEFISQKWNKLPMWAKFGLGAAATASGVWALIVGRRVIGGIATGVGTSSMLDAQHQRGIKKRASREHEELFENMRGVDFSAISAFLDNKIKEVDVKTRQYGKRSLFNKFAGVAIGTLFGTGVAQEYIGKGFHGVKDWLGFGHEHQPMAAHTGAAVKETAKAATVGMAAGHIEDLNIDKGSNFSATLLKEFQNPNSDVYKYHPELKGSNPHELVRRVLIDFKATHPEMHGHNPDYVLANSKIHLSFNAQGLHAELDDDKYGWYEDVDKHAHNNGVGGHDNHPQNASAEGNAPITEPLKTNEDLKLAQQQLAQTQHQIDQLREQLANQGQQISEQSIQVDVHSGADSLQGDLNEKLAALEQQEYDLTQRIGAANYLLEGDHAGQGAAAVDEARRNAQEMGAQLSGVKSAINEYLREKIQLTGIKSTDAINVTKAIFGDTINGSRMLHTMKELKMSDITESSMTGGVRVKESFLTTLPNDGSREFMKRTIEMVKPESGYTFSKWIARVVSEADRVIPSQKQ